MNIGDRVTGEVVVANTDRGFGFVRPKGASRDMFVHVSSFANHVLPPVGTIIEGVVADDPRTGKTRLTNCAVVVIDATEQEREPAPKGYTSVAE